MVYLNFRVFSRGRPDGFLACQEFRSVDQAWLTLALSESDAALLLAFKEDAAVRVALMRRRGDDGGELEGARWLSEAICRRCACPGNPRDFAWVATPRGSP